MLTRAEQHQQPRQQAELFYPSTGSMSDAAQAKTPTLEPDQDLWECPECGSLDGEPVYFDLGRCYETGYDDVGEACTRCFPRVIDAAESH